MSEIYDRIKARRIELGLTVEQLAALMGYKDKSSISKIENGKADIPQSKVAAFARALKTTTAYLVGIDEAKGAAPIPPGFALTCHGNSMAAMIQDGDIVCIRKQPEVENGEIAAVRIGEEATLKRFYRQGDTVMLQAENPAFSPLVYTRDQLNEITIEGRVVGICRGI